MKAKSLRDLAMPAAASGLLMACYLLVRPYGDTGNDADTIAALSSNRWVIAHVAGMLALAQFARTALRLADVTAGATAKLARWAALAGLTLVLPYYGAEAFALHVIARSPAAGEPALIDQVRNQPVAVTMFGLGLLLLAVAAVCVAIAWQRQAGARDQWVAWPLVAFVVLLLPQFFLPAAGRMAYGVGYAVAAAALAGTAWRHTTDVARRCETGPVAHAA